MTTLLERAKAMLARTVPIVGGVSVSYSRLAASVTLSAVPSAAVLGVQSDSGMLVQWRGLDFLLAAADLILATAVVEPKAGDRITYSAAVYEVCSPAMGEPCFFYSDAPTNARLRIHTKKVA